MSNILKRNKRLYALEDRRTVTNPCFFTQQPTELCRKLKLKVKAAGSAGSLPHAAYDWAACLKPGIGIGYAQPIHKLNRNHFRYSTI